MITPTQYTAFITTVNTRLGQIYTEMDAASTWREWASMEPPMGGSVWTTAWTGRMPKARPWFGSRVVHEPALQTYSITPIPYELTYGLDRFALEDSDVNGQSPFWRMLPDQARAWRMQPEFELRDLLEGTGIMAMSGRQLGPDGLSAFSTAHLLNIYNPGFNGGGNALFAGGSYCNDFTGGGVTINGTLIGGALSQTAFTTLLEYMQVIPDESGETLGVIPDAMMVPATLQVEAMFLLNATFLAMPAWGGFSALSGQVGTADNMLRKIGVRPIVNRYLRNTKRWYLGDTSHASKWGLVITREQPRVVPRVNESDQNVYDRHQFQWGGWDRLGFGWNFTWLFARSGP